MIKYYTRACNFKYGSVARQLINNKKALPLCGSNNISFDEVVHESNDSSHPVLIPLDISSEIVHVSSIVADIKLEQFVDWKVTPGMLGAFGDWLELSTQLV